MDVKYNFIVYSMWCCGTCAHIYIDHMNYLGYKYPLNFTMNFENKPINVYTNKRA